MVMYIVVIVVMDSSDVLDAGRNAGEMETMTKKHVVRIVKRRRSFSQHIDDHGTLPPVCRRTGIGNGCSY